MTRLPDHTPLQVVCPYTPIAIREWPEEEVKRLLGEIAYERARRELAEMEGRS